jgi:hypothetical protein
VKPRPFQLISKIDRLIGIGFFSAIAFAAAAFLR